MQIIDFVSEISNYNFRRLSLAFETDQYKTNFRVIEADSDTITFQHINSNQIIVIHEKNKYKTEYRTETERIKIAKDSRKINVNPITPVQRAT